MTTTGIPPVKDFWFEPKVFVAYLGLLDNKSVSDKIKFSKNLDEKTGLAILEVSMAQLGGSVILISSVINVKNGQTIIRVSESKFKEIYADSSSVPSGLYCTTSCFKDNT